MYKDKWCCTKLRAYNYLVNQGIKPIGMKPDRDNSKYFVWFFERNEKLNTALNKYFLK